VIAVYLLTLGASAGIVGLFFHQLLAGQGFVPVFQAGLYLAAGIAFLYITIQTGFMLLVRVYKPTKDRAPLFFECLSHLASLVFLPYVLRFSTLWPLPGLEKHVFSSFPPDSAGRTAAAALPLIEKNAPIILLAVFLSLHGFLKLLSFFAAMRGTPAPRRGALGWLGACALTAMVAGIALDHWVDLLEATRPVTEEAATRQNVTGQYVMTRSVPEGTQFRVDLSQEPGRGFTLLWANDPGDGEEPIGRIHVVAQFEGVIGKHLTEEIRLAKGAWTALRLRPEVIPQGAKACRIVWNAGEEPKWQKFSVLLPVQTSSRRLLVGGPNFWQPRDASTPPNLVVILVDGLSGHKGEGTVNGEGLGSIAALAEVSTVFENAYTPAPEESAAVVSLMRGLSPLRHGHLEGRPGSMPGDTSFLAERLRTQGYLTAAFADEAADSAVLERGFDFYSVPAGTAAGASTVRIESENAAPAAPAPTASERALEWVKANADAKFAVLIDLNDLGVLNGKEIDWALVRNLDRKLAALLKALRANGQTCILLTSPCGLPAYREGANAAQRLDENSLHVPCMLYLPGKEAARRPEVMSLEDLPAVVVNALGGTPPATVGSGEAVSVCGDPVALSIRYDKWRLTWQTELAQANPSAGPGVGTAALYDVERMRRGSTANLSTRDKQTAQRLFERLKAYLKAYSPAG
jgi:hypothetical protein